MRRWTGLALPALALLVVQAAGSLAQTGGGDDPAPATKQSSQNIFHRLNPFARPTNEHAKQADGKDQAAKKKTGPSPSELAAQRQKREEDNWNRRIDVCDRLRDIALQTGDEQLGRMVEQLEQRINQLYNQRTGSAGIGPELADAAGGGPGGPAVGGTNSGHSGTSGPPAARKDRP
jgi:hypothetical protein